MRELQKVLLEGRPNAALIDVDLPKIKRPTGGLEMKRTSLAGMRTAVRASSDDHVGHVDHYSRLKFCAALQVALGSCRAQQGLGG